MNKGKGRRILIIVTSHDRIEADHPTGLWFEEFAVPHGRFKSAGFDVTVASPLGGAAPVDPRSEPKEDARKMWADARRVLQNTVPIPTVNAADFDALFLPGGHGTMFDLPQNAVLREMIGEMAASGKIISAVCHGPAAFAGVTLRDGTPMVAGKTMTSFTDDEERAAGLDGKMPFMLETRMRELGARFVPRPNWSDHVECDGNLITGQNPQSSESVAAAVMAALR